MVAVGVFTKNKAKVLGVERAFKKFFDDVVVKQIYSDRLQLIRQPRSLEEALEGAVKRAEFCHRLKQFDYSVGLEGGIHRVDVGSLGVYIAFHVAYILNEDGEASIGISSSYQVPDRFIGDIIEDEMASVLAKLTGSIERRQDMGFIGYLSNCLLTRVDLTYEAVRNALIYLQWLERDERI